VSSSSRIAAREMNDEFYFNKFFKPLMRIKLNKQKIAFQLLRHKEEDGRRRNDEKLSFYDFS
jgi:hypothetical protein